LTPLFLFRLAEFFFLDILNFSYFVHKIWTLWAQNRGMHSKTLYLFFISRDPYVWRLGIPSYWLKCTTIRHYKKWSMVERGSLNIFWNFWFQPRDCE
jgi:hypothetical protein